MLLPVRESSEDRFNAVFGSGRSCCERPQAQTGPGARLSAADFRDAYVADFEHEHARLWYLPARNPADPLMWVTAAAPLPGGGDPEVSYLSTLGAWRRGGDEELVTLARALCPAQTFPTSGAYGRERQACSAHTGQYVRFDIDRGAYARIVDVGGTEVAYWSREEFAADPDDSAAGFIAVLQGQ